MDRYFLYSILFVLLGINLSINAQVCDAALLNHHTHIEISGGKLIRTVSNEILINNRAGEEFTEVDIEYSKLLKVSKIAAYIRNNQGVLVKKLKSSDITTRSAISDISLYEDNMVKEFTLKHNEYPYILNYSYQEQTEQFLYIDYWSPVLDRKIPTIKALLTLDIPSDYKIKFKSERTSKAETDTIEKRINYSWKATYTVANDPEIFSPSISNYFPYVKIVPQNFLFETKGSFESWQSYGNWQYIINSKLTELTAPEKEKISSLINNIADTREKIKVLYHYLQDATRYINVSVETGGMIPYPASYVCENKYGDCKALSNYFKSVLQFAGIDAYYTKVYANNVIVQIDKSFPSQQSNHIILCIPLKNDTCWLDCTSNGPFNYLGTFTQGRDAYIIDKDKSRFVKTPSLNSADVEVKRQITVKENSDKRFQVDFETSHKGESFEYLSFIAKSYNAENQNLIIRNKYIPTGFDLIDYQLLPIHRDSLYIHFNYTTESDKICQFYGNDLIMRTVPFNIPKFSKPAERNYNIQIDYPINISDIQTYIIPKNYIAEKIPIEKNIQSAFGNYKIRVKQTQNEIQVFKTFELYSGMWNLTKYSELYEFIKNITETDNNTIIVCSKK